MRISSTRQVLLTATDLSEHLSCKYLTHLNLAEALGEIERPQFHDPRREVMWQRGLEHEQAYLADLSSRGHELAKVDDAPTAEQVDRTLELMRSGVEVIVQGALKDGPWIGRPDVLRRVTGTSALGDWHYEAVETKLARETRAGAVLQLCLYSELVGEAQGHLPERMHVVSPKEELAPETLRVADFQAYHRWVRRRLEDVVAKNEEGPGVYPEPVAHCDICPWRKHCEEKWNADDHLSLVADISRGHRRELEGRGLSTLRALAEEPLPIGWKPSHGSAETYAKLREQARVQLEGRERDEPYFELLDRTPGRGLAALPEPNDADVFFDFEGDPFVGLGGLEYLFGWVVADREGQLRYDHLWAFDAEAEKRAFERFIDGMTERLEANPSFHIYHFHSYEPSALKRLMGRHATREAEVDRLLRGEVFVDLHRVTRQALRASVQKYSLKALEAFTGFERDLELPDAAHSLGAIERLLELGRGADVPRAVSDAVLQYNHEDCLSTRYLRDWLEGLRGRLLIDGEDLERPAAKSPDASEGVETKQERILELAAALTKGVPAERIRQTGRQAGRWLLAHLLDYYWREEKVAWWEMYRLRELGLDELIDDPAGIAGLHYVGRMDGGTATRPIDRYSYPEQRVKIRRRADLHSGETVFGQVVGHDRTERTVDIQKCGAVADEHPGVGFFHTVVRPTPKPAALLALGEIAVSEGMNDAVGGRLAFDLLLREAPRIEGGGVAEVQPGESLLEAARRLGTALAGGVLPVQGPPGSGKTYTGARMALDVVRQGQRVGVSATSHKVMRNFLSKILEAAEDEGEEVVCLHRPSELSDEDSPILEIKSYPGVRKRLESGDAQVLAGTPWLWAREEFRNAVDVLFIDEAGQMALADVLVCARGTRNLVLLGDPQQLEQPQQGSHPEGTHVSALQHLLGDAATLPDYAGLFLADTYRLHPDLCNFTSEEIGRAHV